MSPLALLPLPTRPDWDTYFLGIAQAISARGDCRRRQVGAVLVAPDHQQIGTGYNGNEPGEPGCLAGACPRAFTDVPAGTPYRAGAGRCIAYHAEHNALRRTRHDPCGATMYITTWPCAECIALMGAAGVVRAVWLDLAAGCTAELLIP